MGLIETLYSPGVMLLVSLVLIPLLVIGATVALVILLKLVTSGRPDVEKIEYRKYLRYDAGNPPRPGDFRRKVSMQYLAISYSSWPSSL
ncbi:hypothetical protein [Aeropyrum camini]|uniref:hypothetical protein n=1 Tax=Aeropyrum camini TaxID=229980 RepID=UPI00078839E7|nr:hypothetical protein [Aeropyrum camini]